MAIRSPACTPSCAEGVRRLTTHLVQLGVGDGAGITLRLADPVVGDLVPFPAATCRSTQLTEAFSLPPTNHLAKGRSHSSTGVEGAIPLETLRLLCPPCQTVLGRPPRKWRAARLLAPQTQPADRSAGSRGGGRTGPVPHLTAPGRSWRSLLVLEFACLPWAESLGPYRRACGIREPWGQAGRPGALSS